MRCPVDGCTTTRGPGHFMCRPHWRGLPKPLRDEIWRAYRYESVLSEAYGNATDAALEFWREGDHRRPAG